AKHFANVPELGIKLDPKSDGFQHANHIHKGCRFSIGEGEVYENLKAAEKEKIGRLVAYNCVLLDNDANKAKIALIDEQAKEEAAIAKKLAGQSAPK
ncbi:MAG: hypothetical protein KGJ13_11430, partial [Patescibacteria group bacterium]|nr:hypothetical protein [Patescibacteria group bacterium]